MTFANDENLPLFPMVLLALFFLPYFIGFESCLILMGTFSKSFASAGGYIASQKKIISLLRNNSYSYVYGNAMSPVAAQQIVSCLEVIKSPEGKRKIAQLRKNSISLRTKFIDAGCHVLGDLESPVIPVMIYHPAKVKIFPEYA